MATAQNPYASLPTVNAKNALAHIETCVSAGLVPMLYGAPGVGKSQLIAQWCAGNGYAMLDVRLAQMLPEHIAAIQIPNAARDAATAIMPALVKQVTELRAASGKPVLVLMDELTLAPSETLSAALEFILDRRVGGFALPADTAMVAAGNRIIDTSAATLLDPPVCSRLASVVYQPDMDETLSHLRAKHKTNALATKLFAFIGSSMARPLIGDAPGESAAFYTPRGLDMVARALASAKLTKTQTTTLIGSCLGINLAAAFSAWEKSVGALVDGDAILKNPDSVNVPGDRETCLMQLDAAWQAAAAAGYASSAVVAVLDYVERCAPDHARIWVQSRDKDSLAKMGATIRGKRLMSDLGITANAGKARV